MRRGGVEGQEGEAKSHESYAGKGFEGVFAGERDKNDAEDGSEEGIDAMVSAADGSEE